MHACACAFARLIASLQVQTFDVGADVVLAGDAVRAEVDLRRRLVHLGRRAEETHGWVWLDECSEAAELEDDCVA